MITFTPVIGGSAPFLGPGYGFTAKSVFSVVAGHTYELDVQLRDETTGQTACQIDNVNYSQGSNWDAVFGVVRGANDVLSQGAAGGVYGNSAFVTVQTIDVTAQVVVDGPTNFQGYFHDPVGNLCMVIHAASSSGASGSFTDADRTMLTAIDQAVVLPTYVTAVTRVGLTDNGSLNTLPGTRALRVTVTGFPTNAHRDPGTPEYWFDLGFFTMNVAQGWVKSQRLVFEFQTYEAPQALDSYGWTLKPGTVINVEELAKATSP